MVPAAGARSPGAPCAALSAGVRMDEVVRAIPHNTRGLGPFPTQYTNTIYEVVRVIRHTMYEVVRAIPPTIYGVIMAISHNMRGG